MTDASNTVSALAATARRCALDLAALPSARRASLLRALADALASPDNRGPLTEANEADMADAQAAQARGELAEALVKRLTLTDDKLSSLVDGLRQLADMPELVGARQVHRELDEGLVLERLSCPLGVLGVVFEARPDAVPQITGLALKSGNAVLLKGGSEALRTNRALVKLIHGVLEAHGVDPGCVTLLEDRAQFGALLDCHEDVDLIVARGSGSFVSMVMERTKIPVMGHAEGLCHLYLHADAPAEMAARIAVDSKCSYPAACNSIETLLWAAGAEEALDATVLALREAGVELRGDEGTRARHGDMAPASDEDWATEYTAKILSIRRVDDLDAALAHIARYGSGHTEGIVTTDAAAADRFLREVDAAGAFHNASTRFADGYRYGLGAEVGVSTQKLHARGPVGVEGLLTYRYQLRGQGQVTLDYGPGKKSYTHRDLD